MSQPYHHRKLEISNVKVRESYSCREKSYWQRLRSMDKANILHPPKQKYTKRMGFRGSKSQIRNLHAFDLPHTFDNSLPSFLLRLLSFYFKVANSFSFAFIVSSRLIISFLSFSCSGFTGSVTCGNCKSCVIIFYLSSFKGVSHDVIKLFKLFSEDFVT